MKPQQRLAAATCAAVLLSLIGLSATTPVAAVENGVYDRTNPAVKGFGFDMDGPGGMPAFSLCSGFVISDHAFATAAHCLVPMLPITASWAVTVEPGSPKAPATPTGIFNLAAYNFIDFPILNETVTSIAHYIHPDFNPLTMANDVAVIEFPPGTFSVRPVRLPPAGFLDFMSEVGALYKAPVKLAGCGTTEYLGDMQYTVSGYCTRGFAIVTGLEEQSLIIGTNDVMNARTLAGDSGSPQTMFGYAVSVTSFSGNKQRLDTPDVLSFLAPFADKPGK